jgi:uncharacterized protein (UPF0128 family)
MDTNIITSTAVVKKNQLQDYRQGGYQMQMGKGAGTQKRTPPRRGGTGSTAMDNGKEYQITR